MPQGFRFVHNDYHQDETRVTHIPFKDGEEGFARQAVKIDAGSITKASATDAIFGFLNGNVKLGSTNRPCEVILAREGDVFEATYTGTPAGTFVVGANAVNVATDGLSVNSAAAASGPLSILMIDAAKKIVRVKVKQRQMS